MISKYGSVKFTGTNPSALPDGLGDLYLEQDRIRDFVWMWDRLGALVLDLFGGNTILLSGGQVSQGADVSHVDIAAAVGYAPWSVTLGEDGSDPPGTANEDVTAVRVSSAAQTVISLTGGAQGNVTANATLDGATTNYVKLTYAETDSLSRQRARATGTWYFAKAPSYLITIDSTVPTAYEIELATLVGDGSTTLTIAQAYGANDYATWSPAATSSMTLLAVPKNLAVNPSTYTATVNLPTAASSKGRKLRVSNSGTSTGTIVVTPASGEALAGITDGTWAITQPGGWLEIECDGTGWNVVSQMGSFLETIVTSGFSSTTSNFVDTGYSLTLPPGIWRIGLHGSVQINTSSTAAIYLYAGLSTATGSWSDYDLVGGAYFTLPNTVSGVEEVCVDKEHVVSIAASTVYHLLVYSDMSSPNSVGIPAPSSSFGQTRIVAERLG